MDNRSTYSYPIICSSWNLLQPKSHFYPGNKENSLFSISLCLKFDIWLRCEKSEKNQRIVMYFTNTWVHRFCFNTSGERSLRTGSTRSSVWCITVRIFWTRNTLSWVSVFPETFATLCQKRNNYIIWAKLFLVDFISKFMLFLKDNKAEGRSVVLIHRQIWAFRAPGTKFGFLFICLLVQPEAPVAPVTALVYG